MIYINLFKNFCFGRFREKKDYQNNKPRLFYIIFVFLNCVIFLSYHHDGYLWAIYYSMIFFFLAFLISYFILLPIKKPIIHWCSISLMILFHNYFSKWLTRIKYRNKKKSFVFGYLYCVIKSKQVMFIVVFTFHKYYDSEFWSLFWTELIHFTFIRNICFQLYFINNKMASGYLCYSGLLVV